MTDAEYIVQAIRNLKSGCEFTLNGEIFSEWVHAEDAPTWDEIQTEVQAIKDAE